MGHFDDYLDRKYCYNATVTDVYDADTITCDIDCGFYINIKKQKIRLFGINADELRSKDPEEKEKAYEGRDLVRSKILDKQVELYTIKDTKGKYGRWLAIVVTEEGENVNQMLIDKGYSKFVLY